MAFDKSFSDDLPNIRVGDCPKCGGWHWEGYRCDLYGKPKPKTHEEALAEWEIEKTRGDR